MMKINETPERGINIQYTIKGRNKERFTKTKQGIKKSINAIVILIPSEIIPLISNDNTYTYMYEHFEKICLTPNKPPADVTYKKSRLNPQTKTENPNMLLEIPNRFFDIAEMSHAQITYHPNKKDYISGEYGLITLDTIGHNPRKHLRQIVHPEQFMIEYPQYLQQTSNPLDQIILPQDLTEILDVKNLYLYHVDDVMHITSEKPTIECIPTDEVSLKENLEKHHLIDASSEMILFKLYFKETDLFDKESPKIIVEIKQAED